MNDIMIVNFGALDHAGQAIQSALHTLDARLDEVDQLGRRLSATWTGEAQAAYQVRQSAWQGAAEDLSAMLRDIHTALTESMQHYLDTEQRNKGLFTGG
jgi:early secretory antigenic target protein ESAT-6